jgi:hypothetical protein
MYLSTKCIYAHMHGPVRLIRIGVCICMYISMKCMHVCMMFTYMDVDVCTFTCDHVLQPLEKGAKGEFGGASGQITLYSGGAMYSTVSPYSDARRYIFSCT